MSLIPICGGCRAVIHIFLIPIILLALSGNGRTQEEGPGEMQGRARPRISYSPQKTSYLDTGLAVLQSHVNLVLVPVSVTDKRDHSVVGLDKDDFQLSENNRPQRIHSVSLENEPSSIAIVLDLSDSMENKISRALLAIHALLANANAEDEFLLITFSDRPRVAAGFTSSTDEIESVLLSATVAGHTALIVAIDLATTKMQEAKYSRRAIVLISDGGDNHSRETIENLERDLQERDLLIYGVGLYDLSLVTAEQILGPRLMTELSEKSGGTAFDARDRRDIEQAASSIANQVHWRYLLSYYPDKKPDDGKWHTIRVTLLVRDKKHLHVHAKTGYYGLQR